MMGEDRLREFVQRANNPSLNGRAGPVPAERRPSGWVCPVCGTEAEQAAEPVVIGGDVMGWKYLSFEDGTPKPIAAVTQEVLERDGEGNIVREYQTRHCLNCFNAWQRRQMMRDLRANVPQLERKPDAEPDRS